MSTRSLWIDASLMMLTLGPTLHRRGQRPSVNRGESAGPAVPRQAGPGDQPAFATAIGSDLTDMIDAGEPESCPDCGAALEWGCRCDVSECARLLAASF